MKCLLKTIIAIVLIVVIGGLLLWFVGFPALLAEDKVVKNLEKQDYEVQTFNSDDLFGQPAGEKSLRPSGADIWLKLRQSMTFKGGILLTLFL